MNVLLAVSGGIAAYKACELCSVLVKEDHSVRVMMTKNASNFIGKISFEGLTNNAVVLDSFDYSYSAMEHIDLPKWCDVMVIVPCSMNLLTKITVGLCDDIVSTSVAALPLNTPLVIAPAMNTNMWNSPANQRNLELLNNSPRYTIVSPVNKRLACGDIGMGGLADLSDIVGIIRNVCLP